MITLKMSILPVHHFVTKANAVSITLNLYICITVCKLPVNKSIHTLESMHLFTFIYQTKTKSKPRTFMTAIQN